MDRETLLALAAVGRGEARRLSEQLGKPIDADMNALIMLARTGSSRRQNRGIPMRSSSWTGKAGPLCPSPTWR